VFWFGPLIGAFLFGLVLMLVTSIVMPFFIDVMAGAGSDVVACQNLIRIILVAIGTVVSPTAANATGFGWWMTILALLCTVSIGFVAVVTMEGAAWRRNNEEKKQIGTQTA